MNASIICAASLLLDNTISLADVFAGKAHPVRMLCDVTPAALGDDVHRPVGSAWHQAEEYLP